MGQNFPKKPSDQAEFTHDIPQEALDISELTPIDSPSPPRMGFSRESRKIGPGTSGYQQEFDSGRSSGENHQQRNQSRIQVSGSKFSPKPDRAEYTPIDSPPPRMARSPAENRKFGFGTSGYRKALDSEEIQQRKISANTRKSVEISPKTS